MFQQFEVFDADGLPSGKQKFTLIDHYVNIVMGNFKYAIVDNFANLVTNQKALNEILRIRAENRQILNLDRKIGADSTFWWTNVVDVEATNFARIIAMVEVVMLGYSRHFPAEILPQKSKVHRSWNFWKYLKQIQLPKFSTDNYQMIICIQGNFIKLQGSKNLQKIENI